MKIKFILYLVLSLFTCIDFAYAQDQRKIDSLSLLIPEASDTQKVNLYNTIGIAYWNSDVEKAEIPATKALELAKKIKFLRGEASAYNNLAVIAWIKGSYDKAEELYLSSLSIWKQIGNTNKVYEVKDNLALLYNSTGEWKKSLDLYLTNLRQWEKTDNKPRIATSCANLGKLYQTLDRNGEAFLYFKKAYDLFSVLNNGSGIGEAANGLSTHYRRIKQYNEALSYAFIALHEGTAAKDNRRVAFSYQSIGNLYFDEGKYYAALSYYQKQLELAKENKDVAQQASILNNIGKCYGKAGEFERSKSYLNNALKLASNLHDAMFVSDIYSDLSYCFRQQGNYKGALEYYEKSRIIKDSVYSQENIKNFNEIQVKYETEKKNNEILSLQGNIQKTKFDIQEEKNTSQVTKLIFGITILSLLFIFYTFYRYIHHKNKVKLLESKELITDLRLKMLLLQINPHFYFNTLNNIYGQMLEENSSLKSRELILKLSQLMRFLVENAEKEKIAVEDCVRFIENYLAFEKERFGDRCNLVFHKSIRETNDQIAHYVIFPIIENAFKYGTNRIDPFTISIEMDIADKVFNLFVKNEITIPQTVSSSTKKGLSTLERCLQMLYPGNYELKINRTQTEHSVQLTIKI